MLSLSFVSFHKQKGCKFLACIPVLVLVMPNVETAPSSFPIAAATQNASNVPSGAAVPPIGSQHIVEKPRLLTRIQRYSLVRGTRSLVQTVPGTVWATGAVSLLYEPLRNSFLLRYIMDTSDMVLISLLDQCDGAFGDSQQAKRDTQPLAANEITHSEAQLEAVEEGFANPVNEVPATVTLPREAQNYRSFVGRLSLNARESFHYIVYDGEDGRFLSGPADFVFGGVNRGIESFVSTHWPQTKFTDNHNGEFAKSMAMIRSIVRRDYVQKSRDGTN